MPIWACTGAPMDPMTRVIVVDIAIVVVVVVIIIGRSIVVVASGVGVIGDMC